MLMTLIPLFDRNMTVRAYSVFSQKNSSFSMSMLRGSSEFEGAARVEGLEIIQQMGIETLSPDTEIFVPLSNLSVFANVEEQCDAPHERIVFLIDNTIPPIEMYINRLKELKEKGYKLAIRKLAVAFFEEYREVLRLCDYVLLNNRKIVIDKAKVYFGKLYPNVKLIAGNIDSREIFEELREKGGYEFYEGIFYRVALSLGQQEVAPLKVNYIQLLNLVNKADFDLQEVADIIGHDIALTVSLLKMVNRMTINSDISSIRHAAAMLGQKELKRWINTAVVGELCADKPNEITRLSLLRAKFAENLAAGFDLMMKKEELFLMGLFSVLDAVLDKPISEALNMVTVSSDIRNALVDNTGSLAPVYEFLLQYEGANWPEVSRLMILKKLELETVSEAYIASLTWYRALMAEIRR
ncbi:MAG: HDOD domain-containing protein [Lachnospiraceae bacterium]|nr:HDOD domain-containing protein [Lachnospiraceae bacterium]